MEAPDVLTQWRAEQARISDSVDISCRATPFQLPLSDPTFARYSALVDPSGLTVQQGDGDKEATPPSPPLSLVAGMDISFVKDSNVAVSSIAVFSFPDLKLVHTKMQHCIMTEPYIPYYLAFREVPSLVSLLNQLRVDDPQFYPQLLFLDGNGYHHPLHCGVACHLGVVMNIPTIGVAKKYLAVGGLRREDIEQQVVNSPHHLIGLSSPDCPLWGHAVMTGNSTANPVYISPGHQVSFAAAVGLTMMVAKNKVPEPIRQADLLSRQYIRDHMNDLAEE